MTVDREHEDDCACGHVRDEHDEQGECDVDDCDCIYFDAGTEDA